MPTQNPFQRRQDNMTLLPSLLRAESFTTTSSPSNLFINEQRVRTFVVLPNNTRLVIPFDINNTVASLRDEALARANALSAQFLSSEVVLRIGSRDGDILGPDDSIEDVLDLAEMHTFYLGSMLHHPVSPPIMTKPTEFSVFEIPELLSAGYNSIRSRYKICIRWITIEKALLYPTLQTIPADGQAVWSDLTVEELGITALRSLYTNSTGTKEAIPADTEVDVFSFNYLLPCTILTSSGPRSPSLAELELQGDVGNPLNLFVCLRKKPSSMDDTLQAAWWFPYSDRGVSTFITCVKKCLANFSQKTIYMDTFLAVLWELTHFPPLLIAFSQMYETGVTNRLCAIVATCFRQIALQIVPSWIAHSQARVLEASRQIFSWICSLSPSDMQLGEAGGIVRKVQLLRAAPNAPVDPVGCYDFDTPIDIIHKYGSPGLAEVSTVRFVVSRETSDKVSVKALATAFQSTKESAIYVYCHLPTASNWSLRHNRTALLHVSDFDCVLRAVNANSAFKMIEPLSLAQTSLPAITLDASGFVSIYNIKEVPCSESYPCTENQIFGEDRFGGENPGQYLLHKLNPIIELRKLDKSWEVDAWDAEDGISPANKPVEGVMVCMDKSSSMGSAMPAGWSPNPGVGRYERENTTFTRIAEVKDIFNNLVVRAAAFRLPIHLGLVTFAGRSSINRDCELTPAFFDFKDKINSIKASGCTAIWSAIWSAAQLLLTFKKDNPDAKLRVILLTDGVDNESHRTAAEILGMLFENDIVLDVIVFGTNATDDLFRVAKHTGGYAFVPKTRNLLYQIPLLEPFLDIRARPDIVKVPLMSRFYASIPKTPDMKDIYSIPPSRPHPNLNDSFTSLADAKGYFRSIAGSSARGVTSSAPSVSVSGLGRIYLSEIMAMLENAHEAFDVYISDTNMGFWKVVMQGPGSSEYEAGSFLLSVELGQNFPRQPPSIRFITPILHPNITKHGRVCHAVLDRDWNSSLRVYQTLQHIWGLMMSIEVNDTVDPLFTLQFWCDPAQARREVDLYIRRFAKKSRLQHRSEILGTFQNVQAPTLPQQPTTDNTLPFRKSQNPFHF